MLYVGAPPRKKKTAVNNKAEAGEVKQAAVDAGDAKQAAVEPADAGDAK